MPSSVSLFPHQEKAVNAALQAPGKRLIFNDSPGLGKSAEAITTARRLGCRNILVVTPAIVREHWLDQLDLWWPDHPEAHGIIVGRDRKGLSKAAVERRTQSFNSPIQVVSYALLDEVRQGGWDFIVFDEIHRLKGLLTKQADVAEALVRQHGSNPVYGATGTLVPNVPLDVWRPVDILWPGRFGKRNQKRYHPYEFANRYALWDRNEYGQEPYGINPKHAEEFKQRIAYMTVRTTTAEAAQYLPPFNVYPLVVDPSKETHFETLEDYENLQGLEKIKWVKEWLEDAQEEATHICIATHLRHTAEAIAKTIPGATCITGALPPDERNRRLHDLEHAHRAVVVCTMDSVGVGIDLTFLTQALIVELYPKPDLMFQFLKRFSRLSGKVPSSVAILTLRGTVDERYARSLVMKTRDIGAATPLDSDEIKLSQALNLTRNEQALMEELAAAVEGVDLDSLAALDDLP